MDALRSIRCSLLFLCHPSILSNMCLCCARVRPSLSFPPSQLHAARQPEVPPHLSIGAPLYQQRAAGRHIDGGQGGEGTPHFSGGGSAHPSKSGCLSSPLCSSLIALGCWLCPARRGQTDAQSNSISLFSRFSSSQAAADARRREAELTAANAAIQLAESRASEARLKEQVWGWGG